MYDCDYDHLDTMWLVGMTRRIRPSLRALELDEHPSFGYIEKSDWEAGPPK